MLNSLLTGGMTALLLISCRTTVVSAALTPVSDWGAHTPKVNMNIHMTRKLADKLSQKSTAKPAIIVMVRFPAQFQLA
jgi:hypothetical protein